MCALGDERPTALADEVAGDGITVNTVVPGWIKAEQIEKRTRKEFHNGIPAFGTDALRFTFASLASPGRDIKFDLGRAEGYKNFCNKLWNATAYVLAQLDGIDAGPARLGTTDEWIRSRLSTVIGIVHDNFAAYRLDVVIQTLYEFAWHEFCDWYLELTKAVLTSPDADPAASKNHPGVTTRPPNQNTSIRPPPMPPGPVTRPPPR